MSKKKSLALLPRVKMRKKVKNFKSSREGFIFAHPNASQGDHESFLPEKHYIMYKTFEGKA